MFKEVIEIDGPLLNTIYHTDIQKAAAVECQHIGGNCKLCTYAVVVKSRKFYRQHLAAILPKCSGCE